DSLSSTVQVSNLHLQFARYFDVKIRQQIYSRADCTGAEHGCTSRKKRLQRIRARLKSALEEKGYDTI
ncbi:MAG: hypothetical protein ACLRI7_11815, partial [Ruthenibacterium lactatiformans]